MIWYILDGFSAVLVYVVSVRPNDRDVARACARPDRFPVFWALLGAYTAFCTARAILARDGISSFIGITIAAMCARILWHWWRRRRQGKPSRVLGLVRDLGHKLGVVAVPAAE